MSLVRTIEANNGGLLVLFCIAELKIVSGSVQWEPNELQSVPKPPSGGLSSKVHIYIYIYIPVVTRGTGKRRRELEWMVDNRVMIGNVIRICKH